MGRSRNRSYFGQTSQIGNEYDLVALNRTLAAVEAIEKRQHKKIPVIVAVKGQDLLHPGRVRVACRRALGRLLGQREGAYRRGPRPRRTARSPADDLAEGHGRAVEAQLEDVGQDMTPYVDSLGNTYDFGFGLDWKGRIG
jgi:beta-glucosidase